MWRPDYLHLIPLAEVIREVVGHASVKTQTVQEFYNHFLEEFDSEIGVLLDHHIEELKDVNEKIGKAIQKFRSGKTIIIPGGGGEYGEIVIPRNTKERKRIMKERKDEIECRYDSSQKQLSEF